MLGQQILGEQMKAEPVVAKWELWTVATMLVSTHGDDAEAHAQAKLADALECEDETNEIVWRGILHPTGGHSGGTGADRESMGRAGVTSP